MLQKLNIFNYVNRYIYYRKTRNKTFIEKEEFLKLLPKLIMEDNEFKALQAQRDRRFEVQHEEIMKISLAIDYLGRKSDKSLENTILTILNDELIKENIDASQIKKVYLFDEHGKVFWKNYESNIDILIQNGKTILIKVKYHSSKYKIETFVRNSKLYTLQFKKDFDELVMICLEIKRSDLRIAKEFGVKIIAGNILQ